MEITGRVQQILVKDGKDHDIRFELHLTDEDVVQLMRWRGRDLHLMLSPVAEQLSLPTGEATPTGDATANLGERFWIDECSFPIYREHDDNGEPTTGYLLTGRELREMIEPLPEQLWQWVDDPFNAGQYKRELVEDGGLYVLEDGDRFTVLPEDAESPNGHVEDGEASESESEELDLNQPVPIGAGRRGRGAE